MLRARGHKSMDASSALIASLTSYAAGDGIFGEPCAGNADAARGWWRKILKEQPQKHGFIVLIAEILLAATPTGAAAERVFSTVTWHHAPRRARLNVSATEMVCGITAHLRRRGEPDLLEATEAASDAKDNRGRAAKREKRQAAAAAATAGDGGAAAGGGTAAGGRAAAGGGAPAGGVDGQLQPEILEVADSDAEGGEEPAEDPPLAEEEEEEENEEAAADRIVAALEKSRRQDIAECVVNFTSEKLDEMLRAAWQNSGVDIESPIFGELEVPTLETAAAPPARVPSFGDGAEAVDDEEVEELVAAQLAARYGTVAV